LKVNNQNPIGIFDSGFGGLTVMKEVAKLLPCENIIYIGDTARLPYGTKSAETVLQYSLEIADILYKKGCKLLIVACNTACSHSLEALSQLLSIPVIGVIQPGAELIQDKTRVAVLATSGTIRSGVYQNLIQSFAPNSTIYPVACPLFVPLIEEGYGETHAAYLIAESYLSSLKGKIDAALLGCTHYPLMRQTIQRVLGSEVHLIEPASACAEKAKKVLTQTGLLSTQEKPLYQFFATDDPEKFCRLGQSFFGAHLSHCEHLYL
jgi:glutamate racemase